MDFSSWFRPQNTDKKSAKSASASEIDRFFDRLKADIQPTQSAFPFDVLSGSTLWKKNALETLHSIPLAERVEMLTDRDIFQSCFQNTVDREVRYIKQQEIENAKKNHPELSGRISQKNVLLSEGAMNQVKSAMAETFLDAILTNSEVKNAFSHLLDPKVKLTKTDHDIVKIYMHVWRHDVAFLNKKFGVEGGAFQAMIAKGAMDLANIVGEALKKDPCSILRYGVACCMGKEGFDRGDMALAVDPWVARWLDHKMLKALVQGKKLMPLEGTRTRKPTQRDIQQMHRYQSGFKTALSYYFIKSPTASQRVFQMVLPYINKMDKTMQEQMWAILFRKYQVDPTLRDEVGQDISSFLAQGATPESQKTMYGLFIKGLSPALRANILGHMPMRDLKRYWKILGAINKNLSYAAIRTDTDQTFLAWHLFHERELNDDQMKSVLNAADPKKHRNFLFSPKKKMDKDIFSHMCGVFAHSTFYFWQWVRSFKTVRDFNGSLAEIFPTLPQSVRENKGYVAAMDHHFELVRSCALKGDMTSLSALKKTLGPDVFWKSLTQETGGKISGIRSLCQQGKRGLLKWVSDWPIQKQQELFMSTDSTGRTLLADCTGNLERLVGQNVFNQIYKKPLSVESTPRASEGAVIVPESVPSQEEKPQRQIIRIPIFRDHMDQIATNTKLVQDVEQAIETLSKMSKTEIAAELREGWRHHGNLGKTPCAVKDIRGNNYRLGYLLQGDIDRGTGQIAFLFFLTHSQYDSFLYKQADQAVKVATAMMNASRPTPNTHFSSGPIGPAGGNDGR